MKKYLGLFFYFEILNQSLLNETERTFNTYHKTKLHSTLLAFQFIIERIMNAFTTSKNMMLFYLFVQCFFLFSTSKIIKHYNFQLFPIKINKWRFTWSELEGDVSTDSLFSFPAELGPFLRSSTSLQLSADSFRSALS